MFQDHENTLSPSYKIRAARIEDLATLAEIERASAILFRDTPYAFLVGSCVKQVWER